MLLAFLACKPPAPAGGSGVEEESCTPATPGAVAYTERTTEWGLEGVHGGRFAAADVDGDGYPDLLVTEVYSAARDDVDAGVRYHYLLMNRDDGAGGRTFVDETVASGILQNRAGGVGTSSNVHVFGDVDADGDLDLFAGQYYDEDPNQGPLDCSELFLNDGAGGFSLAPASAICQPEGYPTAGAAFTDFDADGVLDLWVTGWYLDYGYYDAAQDQLYRGMGDGTFTDVTAKAGLSLRAGRQGYEDRDVRRPAYGATACDLDGDALPELLATNYGRSWNQLWHNQGGTFVEVGEEAGFASDDNLDYSDNLMYACWCAVHGGCDPAPTVNCSNEDYADYWAPGTDDQPWRLNGNSFTTACGDVDNDGDFDLYTAEIVHDWAGQSADASQLLLNRGDATFERVPNEDVGLARRRAQTGWNEGDLMVAFMDHDNDGWKDILLVSSDYEDTQLWLWRQVSPGQFEEVSGEVGLDQPWPAGLAVADFDRDGDLDVVTGSSTARSGTPWDGRWAHFYENGVAGTNWLQVSGFPVGTRVAVESGGVVQTQEVSGGYGHFGIQNDTTLHFGLGGGCMVDSVVATTVGGAAHTWADVAGNRRITAAELAARPESGG